MIRCGLQIPRLPGGGGEGDPPESEEPSTRDHCPYGHRRDGTCRACPKRTYWAHDGGCKPVEHTPGCPDGHAIVSSWPGKCVPIICPATPVVPGMYEARDADTGYCTCPAGDEWLPDHNGCRPSSCPHGRDSDGRCLPPPTTTTTTVAAKWSAVCQFSFTKGDAASVDLPTHGAGHSYTLKGILPPGLSATPKAGGSYTVAGTPTAGGYWTADLGVSLPGDGSDLLPCSFAVPAAPDPPGGLTADGDSRGIPGSGGQSVVEWDEVVGATSYEVRHKLATASGWTGPVSTTGLTSTLSGLILDRLYFVEVRAVNRYGNSSDTVYTFPTRVPYPKRRTAPVSFANLEVVGIVSILGYRAAIASGPVGRYAYKVCEGTLSEDEREARLQERQIRAGIEVWQSATEHVTSHHSVGSCGRGRFNYIRLADAAELMRICKVDVTKGSACALSRPGPLGSVSGAVLITRIYIDQGAGTDPLNTLTTTLPGSCSKLFRMAMHEAGHAFGLYHPAERHPNESVMYMPADGLCSPTAYDVVAIQAIYQSR